MSLSVPPSRDIVTISFFSIEASSISLDGNHIRTPGKFNESLFTQFDNVAQIARRINEEAKKCGREPPEIVLSILLIPDWEVDGNGYQDPAYQETQKEFIRQVREKYRPLEAFNVRVEDFLNEVELTEAERNYMTNLKANGSNADIIKTRALINNKDRRHLQLDSNTLVADWGALYLQTFGARENEQKDSLVATYYNPIIISANNKIVYTAPNGRLAPELERGFLTYCKTNQHNTNSKKAETNEIYRVVFNEALDRAKLVHNLTDIGKKRTNYPANMSLDEYRITRYVLPAINMSWSTEKTSDTLKALKAIKPIPLEGKDALCDYACFIYLIKKYSKHPADAGGEYAYQAILELSNIPQDLELISKFYHHISQNHPALMPALIQSFISTPTGNVLCTALFGFPANELLNNLPLTAKHVNIESLKSALIEADSYARNQPQRAENYLALAMLENTHSIDKLSNIMPGSAEKIVFKFYQTIEVENKHKKLEKRLDALLSLPDSELPMQKKQAVLDEARRVIEAGNDSANDFCFVPNRLKSKEMIASHLKKAPLAPIQKDITDSKQIRASMILPYREREREKGKEKEEESSTIAPIKPKLD